MSKAQRRNYKKFLAGRRMTRKTWTGQGPKRKNFGDFLRDLFGWKR